MILKDIWDWGVALILRQLRGKSGVYMVIVCMILAGLLVASFVWLCERIWQRRKRKKRSPVPVTVNKKDDWKEGLEGFIVIDLEIEEDVEDDAGDIEIEDWGREENQESEEYDWDVIEGENDDWDVIEGENDGWDKIEQENANRKDIGKCAAKEEGACSKDEAVIKVQDVTMTYKIATGNVSGIKEYVIKKFRRQIKQRELRALNHISFEVGKGEIVGIIGTNGSGKSTLLKIVSGALKPTSGNVETDRRKVQLLTLGTGFDMELTAKENVYLNGSIIGYTRQFLDENYDRIVEFAELEGFMEEKVKNFSSGMVSRLGFAIATAGNAAEILILDEVLSVGDEFFRKKSMERIKEMIHGGSTVLIVSHSMGTITEHCTKAVWIEKGKLRMIGNPKEVCREYRKMAG